MVNKVEKLCILRISVCIVYDFVDLLEVMPPPSATLEAAPPLNIVTHQLNTEGQFAALCVVLMCALDITSACTRGESMLVEKNYLHQLFNEPKGGTK